MTGLEKRKKGAQQEISVAPFPPYFGLFGFVFLFFGNSEEALLYDSE